MVGAAKHQAVALHSESDGSVLYRCAILGYQDTLYARKKRQFYHECRIECTVDFMFGNATTIFLKCTIIARLPLRRQKNTITSQGRTPKQDHNGEFCFQFCDVSAPMTLPEPIHQSVHTWEPLEAAVHGVFGQGFITHDFTVENTAGAAKHQAVALHSESDGSVVYRCAILGYQDTLYARKKRQFYHK
ncbi:pectinesterase/pectinesterase inhibitor PPE8B-like [Aegilops tauschii subsp. strangulata]|uniref:pectinesterase/pectinesterase inhibitor PPE8B-like n=1 Tax=Aegilops tauschii subsp. strangulata TaxID=200361 RepID=UPI00098B047B|nr:probable pectinesterase/pectinesterase inhibitor 44 [Aegilops tauschii subsp. strangulata]